jgi:uncharacterized protein (DUF58 family)
MTPRALGLLTGGVLCCAVGWRTGWPELTALGAVGIALVVLALLLSSGRAAVDVTTDVSDVRAVRGELANVRVQITRRAGGRRRLRMVEGEAASPRRTFALQRPRARESSLLVPVSTERRGLHPIGPFTVLRGDPWSIVRKSAGSSPEGSVLVRPRTHPVRRGFATVARQGDSESLSRRSGDDHFFALRDYVFGDEPRNVHWRSSARSGRLVVKQKVAAAVDGTLVVLDVDAGAYPSTDAFAEAFLEERFEAAVEVAASLCRHWLNESARLVMTTTRHLASGTPPDRSWSAIADELALVTPVTPTDCHPGALPTAARASGCSRLVVVSGAPSVDLLASIRRCGSLSPVLLRVGGVPTGPVPGATVLDVTGPEALL